MAWPFIDPIHHKRRADILLFVPEGQRHSGTGLGQAAQRRHMTYIDRY